MCLQGSYLAYQARPMATKAVHPAPKIAADAAIPAPARAPAPFKTTKWFIFQCKIHGDTQALERETPGWPPWQGPAAGMI